MNRCATRIEQDARAKTLIAPERLLNAMEPAMRRAATVVPEDVLCALRNSVDHKSTESGRLHLLTSLENFAASAAEDGLVCTDTGWPCYYLVVGDHVELVGGWSQLDGLAAEAVRRCTDRAKLRPTMVHPLTRQSLIGNVGQGFPTVATRFDSTVEGIRVIAVPKGGGGEVFGSFYRSLLTADGLPGVYKFIIDCFRDSTYSGRTCPPNIIGIGIGGTPDVCMTLAKQAAVLRLVGDRHLDPQVAAMEVELLDAFNDMGVGPMGCGGVTAALDVHIETAATHTAAMGVAFNAQCHIGRRAVARVTGEDQILWEEDPDWFGRELPVAGRPA